VLCNNDVLNVMVWYRWWVSRQHPVCLLVSWFVSWLLVLVVIVVQSAGALLFLHAMYPIW